MTTTTLAGPCPTRWSTSSTGKMPPPRPNVAAGYRIEGWSNDDYELMRQTVYHLLRDTAPRPGEITALRRDCLETDHDGHPVLIYTNSKANRLNRRLHITNATSDVITTWRERV